MDKIAFDTKDCGSCPIRHRAVCANCQADELAQLEAIKFYRTYQAGQPIVWAGDRLEFVASVVTGIASLNQTMEDGRRQMVGLLFPSDFLGRPGRNVVNYDVTAMSEVTLCCFRKAPFEDLLRRVPSVGSRLLEMTLDELDSAREWMLILGRKTAREKIASLLVIIARRQAGLLLTKPGDGAQFDLPMSRESMSEYLGLTLETVSRQISALKKEGVIVLSGNRSVTVPDFDRLLEETGDDVDGGMLA
ncbi:transcriptional regulator FnrL [Frigidibacter sp. ROC022]|uniref:transcriptional regulator FnrL n=1 Tax=Frigidibacter sp. ROC022 TaxID=2971796 RepID=UPI00215B2ABF|nr:helix-turn-helix domain-containing protein [Frigidibacter sp. ROC022]MCR8724219.1 helix-turn-helix domain-containing protein [Frigidibacter sp. ROC022]